MAIIDAIVREIAPRPGQAMVEIGPGLAALTQPLVERLGGSVELDRDLAARLRAHAQLKVVESDVLKVDFAALADELGAPKLRVVGNLPYNISSPSCSTCCSTCAGWRTSTSCCRRKWWTGWWRRRRPPTTGACR